MNTFLYGQSAGSSLTPRDRFILDSTPVAVAGGIVPTDTEVLHNGKLYHNNTGADYPLGDPIDVSGLVDTTKDKTGAESWENTLPDLQAGTYTADDVDKLYGTRLPSSKLWRLASVAPPVFASTEPQVSTRDAVIDSTDGSAVSPDQITVVQPNHTVTLPTDDPINLLPEGNVGWSDLDFTFDYPNDWTLNGGQPVTGATGLMKIVPDTANKNFEIYVATAQTGAASSGGGEIYTGGVGIDINANAINLNIESLSSLPVVQTQFP